MKKRLRKGIFIASLCVFIGSMSVLGYKGIYEPMQNRHAVKQVQQIYHAEEDGEEKDSSPSSQTSEEAVQRKRDAFAQLKAGNPDTIGWIQIPNTVVDYPVMQSSKDNPELYLRHGYDKKYTQYGCIFLDANCTPAQEMKNLTLYGHNMNDGQMFAAILQYTDLEFYKSAPVIDFDLEGVEGKWKCSPCLRSIHSRNRGKSSTTPSRISRDDEAFTAFIEEMRSRSILNLPVDVNATINCSRCPPAPMNLKNSALSW